MVFYGVKYTICVFSILRVGLLAKAGPYPAGDLKGINRNPYTFSDGGALRITHGAKMRDVGHHNAPRISSKTSRLALQKAATQAV